MKFLVHASGSSGNCYQVTSGENSILIDPGIPIARIKQALNYRLYEILAALVSHSHGDHAAGVKKIVAAGIDTYMTLETAKAINVSGHRTHQILPLEKYIINTLQDEPAFTIIPFATNHDCPGSVGFVISDGADRLLFITDSFYVHNRFKDLNIIAIECNWSEETLAPDLEPVVRKRLYKSHFSLANVEKFLKANDLSAVREIHLIHMSNGNSDPAMFKRRIEQLTGLPTIAHRK